MKRDLYLHLLYKNKNKVCKFTHGTYQITEEESEISKALHQEFEFFTLSLATHSVLGRDITLKIFDTNRLSMFHTQRYINSCFIHSFVQSCCYLLSLVFFSKNIILLKDEVKFSYKRNH